MKNANEDCYLITSVSCSHHTSFISVSSVKIRKLGLAITENVCQNDVDTRLCEIWWTRRVKKVGIIALLDFKDNGNNTNLNPNPSNIWPFKSWKLVKTHCFRNRNRSDPTTPLSIEITVKCGILGEIIQTTILASFLFCMFLLIGEQSSTSEGQLVVEIYRSKVLEDAQNSISSISSIWWSWRYHRAVTAIMHS